MNTLALEDGESNDEILAFAIRFISQFHEIQEAINQFKIKISSFPAVDPKETEWKFKWFQIDRFMNILKSLTFANCFPISRNHEIQEIDGT